MNHGNWNLNPMANYAGLPYKQTIYVGRWNVPPYDDKFHNFHAAGPSYSNGLISSAIWARFVSTKHATSMRIWTCFIIPPKCSMFWRARQNRINYKVKYNQCYIKVLTELPALKIWTRTPQTGPRPRQNRRTNFVVTIPILSASADRPLLSDVLHRTENEHRFDVRRETDESLDGGRLTLSTQLIKPNIL